MVRGPVDSPCNEAPPHTRIYLASRMNLLMGTGVPSNAELRKAFLRILTRGSKNNTYKFALARALLEHCRKQADYGSDSSIRDHVTYDYLAESFVKYYWHQESLFRIKQSFSTKSMPYAVQIIQEKFGNDPAKTFKDVNRKAKEAAEESMMKKVFGNENSGTSQVVPRFQNIRGLSSEDASIFYTYSDKEKIIHLKDGVSTFLSSHYDVLLKAVLVEWTRYLEKINTMPKLVSKIENANAKRGSLAKYRTMFKDSTHCFYCCARLERNYINVDHFIPWSYMFDDDPWNLVLCCQNCNLQKSDSLVQPKFTECLIDRNHSYYDRLREMRQSLDLLDTGKGWPTEIHRNYNSCKESGFIVKCL